MIDISVIIPVHNAADYLGDCLNSVAKQSLENKEIVCVDDGSVDDSWSILQKFAKRYNWIHIYRQENQGSGPARNLGLEKARGRYVAFLDSDDWYVDENALEFLVASADEEGCKAAAGLRQVYKPAINHTGENPLFRDMKLAPYERRVVDFSSYQNDWHYQQYIISRQLIEDNGLRFPKLWRCQDPPFFLKAMLAAGKVCVCGVEFYCYRSRNTDAVNVKHLPDLLTGMCMNMEMAKEHDLELLQSMLVQRINENFRTSIMKGLDSECLAILTKMDELRIVPDRLTILDDICSGKVMEYPEDYKPGEALLLNKFIWLLERNTDFAGAIEKLGVRKVAIYGLGNFGKMAHFALKDSSLKLVAAMDRSKQGQWNGVKIYRPQDELPDCDAIVVAMLNDGEIAKQLSRGRKEKIISFRQMIEDLEDGRIVKVVSDTGNSGLVRRQSEDGQKYEWRETTVSVVLPLSDGLEYLEKTLVSLRGQSMRDIEIILPFFEGDSEAIQKAENAARSDRRIRKMCIPCEKESLLQKGIIEAQGHYVAIMHAGDFVEREALEKLYRSASGNAWPEAVKANYAAYSCEDGKEICIPYSILPGSRKSLYGQKIVLNKVPELGQRDVEIGCGIYETEFLKKLCKDSNLSERGILQRVLVCANKLIFLEDRFYVKRLAEEDYGSLGQRALRELGEIIGFVYKHPEADSMRCLAMLKAVTKKLCLWMGIDMLADRFSYGDELCKLHTELKYGLDSLPYKMRETYLDDIRLSMLSISPNDFKQHALMEARIVLESRKEFAERIANKGEVVIFGMGERGISLARMLLGDGYPGSILFCDNNGSLTGKEVQGFKVMNPGEAVRDHYDALFLLPTPSLAVAMEKQLLELGLSGESVLAAPEVWPVELTGLHWQQLAKYIH